MVKVGRVGCKDGEVQDREVGKGRGCREGVQGRRGCAGKGGGVQGREGVCREERGREGGRRGVVEGWRGIRGTVRVEGRGRGVEEGRGV